MPRRKRWLPWRMVVILTTINWWNNKRPFENRFADRFKGAVLSPVCDSWQWRIKGWYCNTKYPSWPLTSEQTTFSNLQNCFCDPVTYRSGPMLAQSGQGGRFGQISSNPRSCGGLSPKYSNSSFPVDFGGGGLLGSLSEVNHNSPHIELILNSLNTWMFPLVMPSSFLLTQ